MKIVFIGCVDFSKSLLQEVLRDKTVSIVGVVTREQSAFNSDFCSLAEIAKQDNIPYFLSKGNDQDIMSRWILDLKPDAIYCLGWPFLLKNEILKIPKIGVLGYHPTELPKNRGRHPIIWSLVLGLKKTASTLFFMDEGADSGPILSQTPVTISPEDNAATLYQKLLDVAKIQIMQIQKSLVEENFTLQYQDHSTANTWRKRNKADGQIDWRMSANSIHNLVRALYHPYPGAHFCRGGLEFKIWETKPIYSDHLKNIEAGKILQILNNQYRIQCGEGQIWLQKHEINIDLIEGDYL